jgi:hypothetical protein
LAHISQVLPHRILCASADSQNIKIAMLATSETLTVVIMEVAIREAENSFDFML